MIPEFKSEHSLWLMMQDGSKRWDARKGNTSDDRIYAMSFGLRREDGSWDSDVKEVTFVDKETDEQLTLKLIDYHQLDWAVGWIFMVLEPFVFDDEPPW